MSNHDTVLVPIETWAYSSPAMRAAGNTVDIGLFAEALLYYDCVIVNPGNQLQFASFLKWFINQDKLDDFYALIDEGSIKIYDYAFSTEAIQVNGNTDYILANLQDEIQASDNTFDKRFLYHPEIESLFPKARHRRRLYSSLRDNVIEVKAKEIESAIKNANDDYKNPGRISLNVQALVDEVYRYNKLGHPPKVEAIVRSIPGTTKHHLTFNVDFRAISKLLGGDLTFYDSLPLRASLHSNRLIWSASTLQTDLYLPSPMSSLVGDKLYECAQIIDKPAKIIEDLKGEVEFPDIRALVNSGNMSLDDLLRVRKKSRKFRNWLQDESERDRNAIIAYHNEVAKESGIITSGRKAISLFGVLGGAAAGSAVGTVVAGLPGSIAGAAAGSGVGYLAEMASKVGSDWRPVVFGNWFRNYIEDLNKN